MCQTLPKTAIKELLKSSITTLLQVLKELLKVRELLTSIKELLKTSIKALLMLLLFVSYCVNAYAYISNAGFNASANYGVNTHTSSNSNANANANANVNVNSTNEI